jgi:hypothetical protein
VYYYAFGKEKISMKYTFCNINESEETKKQTAEILFITFTGINGNLLLKNTGVLRLK